MPAPASDRPIDTPPPPRAATSWGVLLVLCGAVFLEGADVSIMGVALPSIRDELDLSTTTLQWVVSAYVLGYGGFVLLGGRAADLLGRRRMFLAWTAVFIAFSGLGGFATEGWMLLLARFVTGVAAGFMAPAGLSIITTSFAEGPARNQALLVCGGAAAGGFSFGLVGGGLLTAIGWRWAFFVPVLVAGVLLPIAARVVPHSPAAGRRAGFDVVGAVTLTAAMLLLVTTVVQAPDVQLPVTVATAVGSAALLGVFLAVERRSPAPLVRLGILRSGALVRANLGAALFVGAFTAFQFVTVLYLQELRAWSALQTGVPTFLLLGLAFSLAFGTFTIAATDGIAEHEQGLASGLNNVSIQFGAALGVAVVAAVSAVTTDGASSDAAVLDGYRTALLVPLAAAVLALAVTASGLRRRRRLPAEDLPAPAAAHDRAA